MPRNPNPSRWQGGRTEAEQAELAKAEASAREWRNPALLLPAACGLGHPHTGPCNTALQHHGRTLQQAGAELADHLAATEFTTAKAAADRALVALSLVLTDAMAIISRVLDGQACTALTATEATLLDTLQRAKELKGGAPLETTTSLKAGPGGGGIR